MSSEQTASGSREAQLSPEEDKKFLNSFLRRSYDDFKAWMETEGNMDLLKQASEDTRKRFDEKVTGMGINIQDIIESKKAPAIISGLTPSDPPPPPESNDIQVMDYSEFLARGSVNTLTDMLVEDPGKPVEQAEAFIMRCVGRDPETKKMMVVRIPAKRVPIRPEMVVHYCGSVVADHNAVHSCTIRVRGVRHGYVFDRFYNHNGKRVERCALVTDMVHMAGIVYEYYVPKNMTKGVVRVKPIDQVAGQHSPRYQPMVRDEGYFRDLKRLFERHFMRKNDGYNYEDKALAALVDQALPEEVLGRFS